MQIVTKANILLIRTCGGTDWIDSVVEADIFL